MQRHQVDFTLCFRALSDAKGSTFFALFDQHEDALAWHERWLERLGDAHDSARMNAINPAVIPRNHWVEACIQAAVQGDWTLFHRFDEALHDPFTEHAEFSQAPQPEQRVQATFCGT